MFTGIIETLGEIVDIRTSGTNVTFSIRSSITHELKIDQSLSHNGACLTVVNIKDDVYDVVLIQETLKKTCLKYAKLLDLVNLERAMLANGRFDGHIVQGHIDQTAQCIDKTDLDGSITFKFDLIHQEKNNYLIEQGSITVNGVSLTISNVEDSRFEVCIIPYTIKHTNFKNIHVNSTVNIEFDLLGKYIKKMLPNV